MLSVILFYFMLCKTKVCGCCISVMELWAGIGLGFSLCNIVATVSKWFPDNKA